MSKNKQLIVKNEILISSSGQFAFKHRFFLKKINRYFRQLHKSV